MKAFARLLDQLAFTPARNAKLTLLRDYLGSAPDPERGWALASLTGALTFEAAKPGFIRKAAEARLANIPEFVRPMAKTGIEKFAQERGSLEVDETILDAAKEFFGM